MEPVYVTPYGVQAASARTRLYEWIKRIPLDVQIHNYLATRDLATQLLIKNPISLAHQEVHLRTLARERRPHLFIQRMATPLRERCCRACTVELGRRLDL